MEEDVGPLQPDIRTKANFSHYYYIIIFISCANNLIFYSNYQPFNVVRFNRIEPESGLTIASNY